MPVRGRGRVCKSMLRKACLLVDMLFSFPPVHFFLLQCLAHSLPMPPLAIG